ncbi:hypothetical protein GY14_05050 [Delftia tsuruhatensis]|nr:hypothetical protein GY14_05050 [Delftia tsuruhatensis]
MGALVQAGVDADFDDAHVGAVEVGRQPFGADQRTFGNGRIGMGRAADQGRDVQHGAGTWRRVAGMVEKAVGVAITVLCSQLR